MNCLENFYNLHMTPSATMMRKANLNIKGNRIVRICFKGVIIRRKFVIYRTQLINILISMIKS